MRSAVGLVIAFGLMFGPANAQDLSHEPFAVVELFTSEGCSSCPPADELLLDITENARTNSKSIYTLSFHVDYWNDLGWPDPFSRKAYTDRQRKYAFIANSPSIYTPQMIINGSNGFVGSDADTAEKGIDQALHTPATATLSLELQSKGSSGIDLTYSCTKLEGNYSINTALVERGLESQVTAGENQGRLMRHANVVREFKTSPLLQLEGTVHLKSVVQGDLSRYSLIAYIQDIKSFKILAAAAIPVGK